jgi:hypothetical protein
VNGPSSDIDEIRRALALLFEEGQVAELRALEVLDRGRTRTYSGYFDSMELLAAEAAKLSGRAKGVYITVNEVDRPLLARRANRVAAVGDKEPLTGDPAVSRRRFLMVDADPARAAGISSSDDEHAVAIQRVRDVRDGLSQMGWPEPILADSGNGGHLLYRVDLPADDGGLVKRCLEALHERYGDDRVSIDRTVHNPSRIWKLYGTQARKGDDTPDRPHRLARLLEVPDELVAADEALLQALAGPMAALKEMQTQPRSKDRERTFDLEAWLVEHHLEADGPKPWNGGEVWTFKVCPWNPDHADGAAFVGHLANGALTAGCHHDGCNGRDWQSLKSLFAADESGEADDSEPKHRSASQATRMVGLVEECRAELWHTPDGEAFVTVRVNSSRETFSLRSKRAELWLRRMFYAAERTAPGSQTIGDALNVLRSQALFDGETHDVFVRVGSDDGATYVDLGDPSWSAVRITSDGWSVAHDPPIRLRRPRGMLALPEPRRGGNLRMLREFVNVRDDDDFRLLLSVLVGMLFPSGPYPMLVLQGEQGAAKSTTGEVIAALVDPAKPALRAQPRDGRDLMIAASNRWVLPFDNISDIPVWLSDALCRLSTGAGFATRELYSDDEEVLFDAARPVILTGIDELVTRSDLLDRAILFLLPRIEDGDRRTEEDFWHRFEEVRPYLLGALFDAVAEAKRRLPTTKVSKLPRLADFGLRAAAAAVPLGWTADDFLDAYEQNRKVGHVTAIDASAVAKAVSDLMGGLEAWTGTATELLTALNEQPGKRPRTWPKSAIALSNSLRRVGPNLRAVGIRVEFVRATSRERTRSVEITRCPDEDQREPSSVSSVSSVSSEIDSDRADDFAAVPDERPIESSDAYRFDSDELDDSDALGRGLPSRRASPAAEFDRCQCLGCGACFGAPARPCGQAGLTGESVVVGLCRWCLPQRGVGR